jgi:hypothetical protein
MTIRLHQRTQWLAFAAVIVGSIGFCLLSACWNTPKTSVADDGWRRTERGWERIASWQKSAMASSSVPVYPAPLPLPKLTNRWDTHPAALALVQLAIVLFALLRLPAGPRPSAPNQPARLPELIAKSFRASAFG